MRNREITRINVNQKTNTMEEFSSNITLIIINVNKLNSVEIWAVLENKQGNYFLRKLFCD